MNSGLIVVVRSFLSWWSCHSRRGSFHIRLPVHLNKQGFLWFGAIHKLHCSATSLILWCPLLPQTKHIGSESKIMQSDCPIIRTNHSKYPSSQSRTPTSHLNTDYSYIRIYEGLNLCSEKRKFYVGQFGLVAHLWRSFSDLALQVKMTGAKSTNKNCTMQPFFTCSTNSLQKIRTYRSTSNLFILHKKSYQWKRIVCC